MHRILLFILTSFSAGHLMAQQSLTVSAPGIISSTGTETFYYGDRNEPARAIEFKPGTVTSSSFVANINQYFGIPADFTFVQAESNTDDLGMHHRHLLQFYKGIPVEGMGYRVHEKDGFVTSANGKAVRDIHLDTQVSISEEYAYNLAVKHLQSADDAFKKGRKLIVSKNFTFKPGSFAIAYQFDIDVSIVEQWRISVDARSGDIINKVNLVNTCFTEDAPPLPYGTGTGVTNYYGTKTIQVEKYSGGSSRLVGQTLHGGKIGTYDFRNVSILSLTLFYQYHEVYDITSSNNSYTNPRHKPAISVQWSAEQAYEYYYNKHNRNSFDNLGSQIKCYVHVDQNLNNAFWTRNTLAFGDGSNNNPLVELDVVGHELTHGVTQYEAGLQYAYESGALNESFSDILGKAIEFYAFGDTATWQLAKHYRPGGLRDMSNPNLKQQPDTYRGDFWYTGSEDSGGVHTNSGVQNFWFYLLCKGGSGINDKKVSYSVTPIGMDAAAKITYRNLTQYLSNYSDYLDSRIGSLLATADLHGKNSAVYLEVAKAWDAVGVIDEPIITNLDLYDITATTVKMKGSFFQRGEYVTYPGGNVTYHFEYGTTPVYGTSTPTKAYNGTVEGTLTGLQSETRYYLRLVATNENGNSYATAEFTTIPLAPLVRIKPTVDVTETTAIMYGQVNPNSLFTSFYFEYGTTPSFGMITPTYPVNNSTEFQNVSATVTGLQPRLTYYYRLVATNSSESSRTGSETFFTGVKPVIVAYAPVAAPVGAVVTITGQNFNASPEKNLVSFGATRGTILSSSTTEIKVKVPAGASLGPISLLDTESGLVGESVREFVPTFTGEFNKSSLALTMGTDVNISQTLIQDMDGDNKPDIVGIHGQGFSVFQNVNQGGLVTHESFVRNIFNSEYSLSTSYLIDFDGNGLKDIAGRYQNMLRVYPNFSVPGYVFFGTPVDIPIEGFQSMTFGDFDQDGRIDIAGKTYSPGDNSTLVIYRNQNPEGVIAADNFVKQFSMLVPYHGYYLYSDDLNNDGKPELISGVFDKNFVPILKNNSRPGVFAFEQNMPQDLSPERLPQYVSQDFNQDGWIDIASYSTQEVADVTMLENNRTTSNITMKPPFVALNGVIESSLQPADLNGDGKVDLLAGSDEGVFVFLKNKVANGEPLQNASFEKFAEYGVANSKMSAMTMSINDLNGDGRPEIINTYSYNYLVHEGFEMEIWQNSANNNCIDPSLIKVIASRNSATIVLPPNTTIDQFDIEYARSNGTTWSKVYTTTIDYLSSGASYKLRARAKCYLGFTDYQYISFTMDCVDSDSFTVSSIGVDNATLSATSLSSFEVQYSPAGKNQWITLPDNARQISNLLPGTTYDVRFRGRSCNAAIEFKYKQFTTLCPKLSTLTVANITFNQATARWTSNYTAMVIVEYSADNVNWTLADEAGTMLLPVPAKQYFVRARMVCTNTTSDFIATAFTAPCPRVSTISADDVTPFSATVNWVDESNTGNYTLTYSVPGGNLTIVETPSTSVEIDGLTPGTKYVVAVAPHCIHPKVFMPANFNTVCYVPFNLSASDVTYTTAELSWNDNFSGVPYYVDYAIVGTNDWATSVTESTAISLSGLRPGAKYEARVHIDCTSETPPYAVVQFETSLYNETAVTPNPTDSKITIHPSKNLIGNNFSIYDNAGKRLADGQLIDYTIDLANFSPGVYILKIDGEKILRIIKY